MTIGQVNARAPDSTSRTAQRHICRSALAAARRIGVYDCGVPGDPGAQHELGMMYLRGGVEPRRLDRRAWVWIALASAPLLIIAILGLLSVR